MAGFQKINTADPVLNRVQDNIAAALAGLSPPVPFQAVTVAKDYAATGYEGVIHVDAARGPVRITLPKPSTLLEPLTVKQVNQSGKSGAVTVVATGGAKAIAGSSSLALDDSGTGSVTFTSDGTQHWPSTGAGGNPPVAPPASQIQYVGKAPIYVTGNVIGITLPDSVPTTRRVDTAAPLVGGGPLSADLTLGIQGAIVSGDTSTTAQNLGALTAGVLEMSAAAGVATVATFGATVNRIPFGSGSNNGLTDSANLTFASGALTLAGANGIGSAIEMTQAAPQQINKTGGNVFLGTADAHSTGLYTNNLTRLVLDSSGNLRLNAYTTAGHLQTDASGNVTVDTTTYLSQAYTTIQNFGSPFPQRSKLNFTGAFTVADNAGSTRTDVSLIVPAATEITISSGAQLQGVSTFTYDTGNDILASGAHAINGASLFTNTSLVIGKTTNSDRDRVQFNLGGGTLGATGTGDNTFVDIIPGGTAVRTGVSGGIYATARIRGLTYTAQSGTPAITEATTLYIDAAPVLTGVTGATPNAIHVKTGGTFLEGNVTVNIPGGTGGTTLGLGPNGGAVSAGDFGFDHGVTTGATTDFMWISSCAGTPAGTPGNLGNRGSGAAIPLCYDRTNKILYAYAGGAWNVV